MPRQLHLWAAVFRDLVSRFTSGVLKISKRHGEMVRETRRTRLLCLQTLAFLFYHFYQLTMQLDWYVQCFSSARLGLPFCRVLRKCSRMTLCGSCRVPFVWRINVASVLLVFFQSTLEHTQFSSSACSYIHTHARASLWIYLSSSDPSYGY